MEFDKEEIINSHRHSNNEYFEKKLIKNFDKNLLLAGVLGLILLISILYFDITISSSIGFILLLIPLFFILIVALEISHNQAVTALKAEQLVKLNTLLFEIQSTKSK